MDMTDADMYYARDAETRIRVRKLSGKRNRKIWQWEVQELVSDRTQARGTMWEAVMSGFASTRAGAIRGAEGKRSARLTQLTPKPWEIIE